MLSSPGRSAPARHDQVAVARPERWLRARSYDEAARSRRLGGSIAAGSVTASVQLAGAGGEGGAQARPMSGGPAALHHFATATLALAQQPRATRDPCRLRRNAAPASVCCVAPAVLAMIGAVGHSSPSTRPLCLLSCSNRLADPAPAPLDGPGRLGAHPADRGSDEPPG
jgi:hypothetical protein